MKHLSIAILLLPFFLSAQAGEKLTHPPIKDLSDKGAKGWNDFIYDVKGASALIGILEDSKDSFEVRLRDCRKSVNGPMMSLAPSHVATFQLKTDKNGYLTCALFKFTDKISWLQLSTQKNGSVQYWVSNEKSLLDNFKKLASK
ncbi:MAG: hypothetical protein ABGY95_01360 [Rubritalea sp.]|uniref:hypothetical protein n=1 Tax=Rubritalea sp. TaxID=2109375 RepID=UPI003242DD16